MKANDVRERADVELHERLDELRKGLFQARFRAGQDEVEERGKTRKLKREVARVLTILKERELGIERGRKPAAGKES